MHLKKKKTALKMSGRRNPARFKKSSAVLSLENADPASPEHVEPIFYAFGMSSSLTQPVSRASVIAVGPIEIQ